MAQLDLEKPLRRFICEAIWLREEFVKSSQSCDSTQGELAGEMIVIRLHDSWARFCRELIIVSAYGNVTTLGGRRLTPGVPSITSRAHVMDALYAQLTKKQRRNEPKWYSATECINAAQKLKIQNLKDVAAALGDKSSPASSLREVRNFYAHRKKSTALAAISAGKFTGLHKPRIFHLNSYTAGGDTILESWIRRFIAIATAASQ